jgi:hypothetical protein
MNKLVDLDDPRLSISRQSVLLDLSLLILCHRTV